MDPNNGLVWFIYSLMFSVQCSVFSVQCSVFSVQCSACAAVKILSLASVCAAVFFLSLLPMQTLLLNLQTLASLFSANQV
ncbi:unnamed protein product [Brassica oleracea]